jgi:hypothetical protein
MLMAGKPVDRAPYLHVPKCDGSDEQHLGGTPP